MEKKERNYKLHVVETFTPVLNPEPELNLTSNYAPSRYNEAKQTRKMHAQKIQKVAVNKQESH